MNQCLSKVHLMKTVFICAGYFNYLVVILISQQKKYDDKKSWEWISKFIIKTFFLSIVKAPVAALMNSLQIQKTSQSS